MTDQISRRSFLTGLVAFTGILPVVGPYSMVSERPTVVMGWSEPIWKIVKCPTRLEPTTMPIIEVKMAIYDSSLGVSPSCVTNPSHATLEPTLGTPQNHPVPPTSKERS